MAKQRKSSDLIKVIALFVSVIVVSIIGTLAATNQLPTLSPKKAPRMLNMSDAVFLCEKAIKDEFGASLQAYQVDDLSSRLDNEAERFKIFMSANIYKNNSRQGGVSEYLVNCFTYLDRFDVALFDSTENKVVPSRANKGGTGGPNPFGFPR